MEDPIHFNETRTLIMSPTYLEPYAFEQYDFLSWYVWMENNWQISVYLSVVYMTLVYFGQKWMEKREAFSLKGPLVFWIVFLCLGSWFMFLRMYPEPLQEISHHGIYHSICNKDNHTVISSFWCLVFTFSKILEFGDTGFIILRKQKLIFLHYYHHLTVAMYTFYTFRDFDPAGRYFGSMNSFIHTLMYGYYAARAMGLKLPRRLAMGITSLQILQMFVGLCLGLISLVGKGLWDDCDARPWDNILWALAMYSSYVILFLHFFAQSYSVKKSDKPKVQ